jgi:hypothetical protein
MNIKLKISIVSGIISIALILVALILGNFQISFILCYLSIIIFIPISIIFFSNYIISTRINKKKPSNQAKRLNPKKLKIIGALLLGIGLLGFIISFASITLIGRGYFTTEEPIPFLLGLISFYILIPAGSILLVLGFLKSRKFSIPLLQQEIIQRSSVNNKPLILENKKIEQPHFSQNANILPRIEKLLSINPNIFVDDIKKEMINEQYNNVEKLLIEREHTLEEFKHLEIQLKSLNTTRSNLTKRLAEGEISSSAFEKARDDLELEIKDIEEHLWKIRIQLFKDEYEKPF